MASAFRACESIQGLPALAVRMREALEFARQPLPSARTGSFTRSQGLLKLVGILERSTTGVLSNTHYTSADRGAALIRAASASM